MKRLNGLDAMLLYSEAQGAPNAGQNKL